MSHDVPREPQQTPEPPTQPTKKVKYPPELQFAGFAWLFIAAVQLFGVVMLFINLDSFTPKPPPAQVNPRLVPTAQPVPPPAAATAAATNTQIIVVVVSVVAAVVALVFGVTGLQALSGGAKSFFGAGVASIFLGLLAAASGVALVVQVGDPIGFVTAACSALGALGGGVAAIGGSKKYSAWRAYKKEMAANRK